MRRFGILVLLGGAALLSGAGPTGQAAGQWLAMMECSKPMQGKSSSGSPKNFTVRIGLATITASRGDCALVHKDKSTGAALDGWAKAGWTCPGRSAQESCMEIDPSTEELGLSGVRRRLPTMNTYLVFTDHTGHLTQLSIWDLPARLAGPLCETFRREMIASGIKDAECILGTQ